MKVLLLNTNDSGGGAAIGAVRLTTALNKAGIDATLGVVNKKSDSPYCIDLMKKHIFFKRAFFAVLEKLLFLLSKTSNPILHSLNWYSKIDIKKINNSDYDIVHLHWINGNMISIRDIAKITKPIVWTMHDSWVCCAAEHHPNILENDVRYTQGYTYANKPKSTKGLDICRWVYKRKEKYFANMNKLQFIAPSNWECSILKKSKLFSDNKCTVIHNLIDRNIFKSLDNVDEIKRKIGLSLDKKIIGFGAAYDVDNPRSLKGGRYLLEALKKLPNPNEYQFLVFGPADKKFARNLGIEAFYMGYISNPTVMAELYNVCDVFVCPSIIENLPYTCLESICCGTPVAAFNTGGIPDVVEHRYNGYLAKSFDIEDLAEGILYVLENKTSLSQNALCKAAKDFDWQTLIKKHIEVYENVLVNIKDTK